MTDQQVITEFKNLFATLDNTERQELYQLVSNGSKILKANQQKQKTSKRK